MKHLLTLLLILTATLVHAQTNFVVVNGTIPRKSSIGTLISTNAPEFTSAVNAEVDSLLVNFETNAFDFAAASFTHDAAVRRLALPARVPLDAKAIYVYSQVKGTGAAQLINLLTTSNAVNVGFCAMAPTANQRNDNTGHMLLSTTNGYIWYQSTLGGSDGSTRTCNLLITGWIK